MSKKSNSEPKRHHFVPEMHQRNFLDAKGKLYVFLKKNADIGIRHCAPREIFAENHLYSVIDLNGEKNVFLEKAFAEIEGKIKLVIDKLIYAARANDVSDLTREDIDDWLLYFYFQMIRTPDFYKEIQNSDPYPLAETIKEIKKKFPNKVDEIDALFPPDQHAREIRNAHIHVISKPRQKILGVLKWRGISIAKIAASGKSFILGSNPVVRMGSEFLGDVKTELWLPIAPDIAIGLGIANGQILTLQITETSAIRRMNLAIAKQSSSFASPSRELVSSLANELGYKIK